MRHVFLQFVVLFGLLYVANAQVPSIANVDVPALIAALDAPASTEPLMTIRKGQQTGVDIYRAVILTTIKNEQTAGRMAKFTSYIGYPTDSSSVKNWPDTTIDQYALMSACPAIQGVCGTYCGVTMYPVIDFKPRQRFINPRWSPVEFERDPITNHPVQFNMSMRVTWNTPRQGWGLEFYKLRCDGSYSTSSTSYESSLSKYSEFLDADGKPYLTLDHAEHFYEFIYSPTLCVKLNMVGYRDCTFKLCLSMKHTATSANACWPQPSTYYAQDSDEPSMYSVHNGSLNSVKIFMASHTKKDPIIDASFLGGGTMNPQPVASDFGVSHNYYLGRLTKTQTESYICDIGYVLQGNDVCLDDRYNQCIESGAAPGTAYTQSMFCSGHGTCQLAPVSNQNSEYNRVACVCDATRFGEMCQWPAVFATTIGTGATGKHDVQFIYTGPKTTGTVVHPNEAIYTFSARSAPLQSIQLTEPQSNIATILTISDSCFMSSGTQRFPIFGTTVSIKNIQIDNVGTTNWINTCLTIPRLPFYKTDATGQFENVYARPGEVATIAFELGRVYCTRVPQSHPDALSVAANHQNYFCWTSSVFDTSVVPPINAQTQSAGKLVIYCRFTDVIDLWLVMKAQLPMTWYHVYNAMATNGCT